MRMHFIIDTLYLFTTTETIFYSFNFLLMANESDNIDQ